MPLSAEIVEKIRTSFASQSMMTTMGARIEHISRGEVNLGSDIPSGCLQQQGFGHAALAFGMGDSAAGYAALSVMPPDMDVLTSEMKIHLLSPASGDRLVARGRVIKPGRRLVIVQADVFAVTGDQEKHVALLLGTMVPVPSK